MSLQAGTRIGGFEVVGLLGVGGMGEVYRARDTRLSREVAVKILPSAFTSDPDRLARFEREARMLATLNHPNVGSIYGLEESDGIRALVLELVEGETLADRLARTGALSIRDALSVAEQVALALDAAHEKGIVHRDLKPANIKISPDGVVKVLDFGLAKPDESAAGDLTHSPTITAVLTGDGVILGTAAYMSPEQARGQLVDKRTDIWAFGCVLYEMLTGRSAFGRPTITDTLAAIVTHEPDWTALPSALPQAVDRLLHRCLEKSPKERLRDIADARDGLRPHAAERAKAESDQARHSNLPWIVAAVASVAFVAALVALVRTPAAASGGGDAPSFGRIVALTSGPAREFSPAVAPDGKWVAYISTAGGRPDVWVKFLAGGEAANLTAAAGLDISGSPAISGLEIAPDGSRLAVMAKPRGATTPFATWEIPAPLPGAPRKILDDSFVGMRWSPDATRMTFIRAGSSAGDALWVADGDGANMRELIPAKDGVHIHWPAWSSDGQAIYFIRARNTLSNLDQAEIYRVDPQGGDPEPVVSTERRAMFPLPVPGGLFYSANPAAVDLGLWWKPLGEGEPRRLTFGLGDYHEPRISADGRTLVATRYDNLESLIRVEATPGQFGRMVPVTDGYGGDLDPNISAGADEMVFSSTRGGDRHVWAGRLDGSALRPVTSGTALDDRPMLSPDGRLVAFNSDRGGRRGIWLVDAGGGTARKLADASALGGLGWSRDGTELVYAASAGEWPGLFAVSVPGGQVRQIPTPGAVGEPVWSPTSDVIAYLQPATSGPGFVALAFVNAAGEPQLTDLPRAPQISVGFANGMAAWSPDGRRIAVVSQNANAAASVWVLDLDRPSAFRKLVELPIGPRIRGLTWTQDGSAVIIGQHDTRSDIVLLDNAS